MPCHTVDFGNGSHGIVCTGRQRRKRCVGCGRPADLLCDWKVKDRRSGTCDEPICAACTHKPAEGKDLCPKHAAEWASRQGGDHG